MGSAALLVGAVLGCAAPGPRQPESAGALVWRFLDPALACDDAGNVYVAATEHFGSYTQIFFAASNRYGEAWGPSFQYVNRSRQGDSGGPHLATGAAGEVFVLWEDTRTGRPDLFFNRSLDGGATWLDLDVPVSVPLVPGTHATSPVLASDRRGNVYAVWVDTRDGDPAVYVNRSRDRGARWQPEAVRLTRPGLARKSAPSVVCDEDGGIYIAWREAVAGDLAIYCRGSRDFGETWGFEERLLSQAGASEMYPPSLCTSNGVVLVAWLEVRVGRAEIRCVRSPDRGQSWDAAPATLVAGGGPWFSPSPPQIQSDRFGHVYVGWQALTAEGVPFFVVLASADAARRFHETRFPRSAAPLLPGNAWPPGAAAQAFRMRADNAGNVYFAWIDAFSWTTSAAPTIGFDRVSNYGDTWLGLPRRVGLPGHPPLALEPPLLSADEFGHVYLLWNEGVTLTVAASPFYGDSGWRYEHF